ncbi:IS66 family transposase [Leisingera sp. M658]|uniref:IS66 family transposase n=1 Tax=Leisingera sp. M658 TaxID=2867015 RepID=UPI0021A7B530|nr:IS66 family transposase [Leisingera sp. M658]UWQ74370.1 IS66 family transposase [Leisingera sp. M658]
MSGIGATVCDECPCGGGGPPAAWYRFTANRKGGRPTAHLASNQGWMHAGGFSGFNERYRSGAISEAACMAHIRRKFVDVFPSQGLQAAEEAIRRIAGL